MSTAGDGVKKGVKITIVNNANFKMDINEEKDVRKSDDTSRQSIPMRGFKYSQIYLRMGFNN
jgi:hypothetical protein